MEKKTEGAGIASGVLAGIILLIIDRLFPDVPDILLRAGLTVCGTLLVVCVVLFFKPSTDKKVPKAIGNTGNESDALQKSNDERIIVTRTPEELRSYFIGHTDLEAQRLIAPYIDKWITVRGPIADVRQNYGQLVVILHED